MLVAYLNVFCIFASDMVILCRYILLFYAALLFDGFQEPSGVSEIEQDYCCVEDVLYDGFGSDSLYEQDGLLSNSRQIQASRDQSQKRIKQNSRNSFMLSAIWKYESVDFALENYADYSLYYVGLVTNKHRHLTILRKYLI